MKKVTAIVPAYNESKTISSIVKVLKSSKHVGQVIVVSDGSTDNTDEIAHEAGADKVFQLPIKKGKGAAMQHGVAHADGEVIAFFDADLKGLDVDHIERIILPVASGAKIMNVGLRDRGKLTMALMHYLPLIGGERAMQRHVFESIPDKFLQGFMIESALNYFCRSRGYSYGGVNLPGLKIVHKYEKVGWAKGVREYVSMGWEVVKAMIRVRIAYRLNKF